MTIDNDNWFKQSETVKNLLIRYETKRNKTTGNDTNLHISVRNGCSRLTLHLYRSLRSSSSSMYGSATSGLPRRRNWQPLWSKRNMAMLPALGRPLRRILFCVDIFYYRAIWKESQLTNNQTKTFALTVIDKIVDPQPLWSQSLAMLPSLGRTPIFAWRFCTIQQSEKNRCCEVHQAI